LTSCPFAIIITTTTTTTTTTLFYLYEQISQVQIVSALNLYAVASKIRIVAMFAIVTLALYLQCMYFYDHSVLVVFFFGALVKVITVVAHNGNFKLKKITIAY
jgi:hypothetical protein